MTGDTSDLIAEFREVGFATWTDALNWCERAADHIAALEADIAQLRDGSIKFAIINANLGARCTELEAVLKPFARLADEMRSSTKADNTAVWGYNNAELTYGDFRRARAARLSSGRTE